MKRGPKVGRRSNGTRHSSLQTARECWGDAIPAWIIALAQACDRASQNAIARQLSYSGSVISAVLHNSYRGDLERVKIKVRGALLSETVMCPIAGEIGLNRCADNQVVAQRNFRVTSAYRTRLRQACKSCRHNRFGTDE